MRLYALVEAGDPEAIDVFIRPEDAQRALQDCLRPLRSPRRPSLRRVPAPRRKTSC